MTPDYAAEWEARARVNPDHEACSDFHRGAWLASAYRPLSVIMPALAPVLTQDCRLFDLGCGPARITLPVAHAVSEMNGAITGVDIAPSMVARAKARARWVGLTNTTFTVAMPGSIPVAWPVQGGFSVNVFQHCDTEAIKPYLFAMDGILVKGGRFVFQWVEGSESAPWMYQYSREFMGDMVAWAGLDLVSDARDPWQKNWRWSVCQKR